MYFILMTSMHVCLLFYLFLAVLLVLLKVSHWQYIIVPYFFKHLTRSRKIVQVSGFHALVVQVFKLKSQHFTAPWSTTRCGPVEPSSTALKHSQAETLNLLLANDHWEWNTTSHAGATEHCLGDPSLNRLQTPSKVCVIFSGFTGSDI